MKQCMAKEYAYRFHEGQFRKKCGLPYIIHPENVVLRLQENGFCDDDTLAIGWLHDTLEDTSLTYEEIMSVFGKSVAKGVYLLTRNVGRDEYKQRLLAAPVNVMAVKLCDTLDNVRTLECLSTEGIERKVSDCIEFYIPLAQRICPQIAMEMKSYLRGYI